MASTDLPVSRGVMGTAVVETDFPDPPGGELMGLTGRETARKVAVLGRM